MEGDFKNLLSITFWRGATHAKSLNGNSDYVVHHEKSSFNYNLTKVYMKVEKDELIMLYAKHGYIARIKIILKKCRSQLRVKADK